MSYTPTQWQTGDTITAEKLNNMESGIEAANEGVYHIPLVPGEGDTTVVPAEAISDLRANVDKYDRFCFDLYRDAEMGSFLSSIPACKSYMSSVPAIVSLSLPPDLSNVLTNSIYTSGNGECIQIALALFPDRVLLMLEPQYFTIVLTVQSQDYSGSMSVSAKDIFAAAALGKKIVFSIMASGMEARVDATMLSLHEVGSELLACAHADVVIPQSNVMVHFSTGFASGNDRTYSTHIYQLTPAT